MKKSLLRIISILLCIGMIFTMSSPMAWTTQAYAADGSTWTEVTDIAAAAASDKPIAITMTKGSTIYALPTAKVTANPGPAAIAVTVSDGKLSTSGVADDYGWTITETNGKYNITNSSGLYLYVTNSNSGVRINTKPSVGADWSITSNYLTAQDTAGNTRYLGATTAAQSGIPDWRCYTSINSNITGETLQFWELESGGEAEQPIAYWPLIEEDIVDGAIVVIYHPDSGMTLTGTASGAKLAGTSTSFNDEDKLGLTNSMVQLDVREEDGLFTFVTSDEKFLTAGATGSSLTFEDAESDYSKWTLEKQTDGTWYIINANAVYNNNQQALEYYSGFTTYGVQANNAAYKFELYGDNGTPVTPQGPFTVTVEPAENGTVTASKTEDIAYNEEITITATPDEGYVLDKLLVNNSEVTVDENGTVTVKITKNTTVSGTFKEDSPQPAATEWPKLTEAPVDGAQVVIYHPTTGLAMTSTASGSRLAGETATISDDKLTVTDTMAVLDVTVEDDVYTFANQEGKYLTSGSTGNSLTFADSESDYSKWTVEQQTDGTWIITNLNAVYNGKQQALEYYNGFTTYGVGTTTAYKFDFYGTVKNYGLVTDLADLEDGDYVVIYNPSNSFAMTSETYRDFYLMTGEAVIEDDKVVDPADDQVWQVTINSDGTYTFTQDNNLAVTAYLSGTYTELTSNASISGADTSWILNSVNAETHTYNMESKTLSGSYGKLFIEVFNKNVNGTQTPVFCTYSTAASNALGDAFGMQFYRVKKSEPTPVEGDDFGLTSTLSDGDEVIIYNDYNGRAVGNTLAGYSVAAVSVTPEEGVITTGNTDIVWTVVKNDDGTYNFTQEGKTLGGVVSGTYNNLVVTDSTYADWILTGPDAEDFNYYMYLEDMPTTYSHVYLEYYNGFTLYGENNPTKDKYGVTFYKKGAEPETPTGPVIEGDLVTSLSQLEDGTTVAIYSPTHNTAISTKPNGDWYLKANPAIIEDGEVKDFTSDFVWTVKVNDNGTYSFYSNDEPANSISVWPSGTYAELTVNTNYNSETVNEWVLSPFSSENHTWYFKSSTLTIEKNGVDLPVYIEAYVRNGGEVFSGYAPFSSQLSSTDYALQFYLVDPADAVPEYDDGEWDGILTPGEQYVIYSDAAKSSLGLFKEANYSLDAIPTTIIGDKADPGNGAYVFTIGSTGRYYTFKVGDQYLATNNDEVLFFADPKEDGSIPGTAKWYLYKPSDGDGYVIFNKEANYSGSPVCIEYYSSVFSGWTYKANAADTSIFYFDFYKVTDDTIVKDGVVQDPSVVFDCEGHRYFEQDFPVTVTLDDLCEEITEVVITYTVGGRTYTVSAADITSENDKVYSFTIPSANLDAEGLKDSFTITVAVTNGYEISYTGEKEIEIIDEPFFEDLTPAPNAQTGDDKRPVISAKVGNVGDDPTFAMTVNGEEVQAVFENGVLSYTPTADMEDGRVTVSIKATRADGVEADTAWSFIVGLSDYQLYFGQLHSHTTYSDGSGTLDTALEYIAALPESANVQFVAFTDHSNYFDAPGAANPAAALNDASLMTTASKKEWDNYKGTIAEFNSEHTDLIAIGGFEMTWSGGPGHINTFDSEGLVSRNNNDLNNKSNDAGMRLYYETINGGDSLSQFNHPGDTFGNFQDFSYRDDETDAHMFLVEVGNGEGQIGAGGYYPSYEQYTLALDNGWHVAPTNNQDNHKGRWGNANDARDVVLTNDFSEQGIYDAIRALRVYATEDKNLQIIYTVNDEPMGTIFSEENIPETLNVDVTLYDPNSYDSTSKVELVANGGTVVKTWNDAEELAGGKLTAELEPEYSYYFVRVTQEDGDLAVTAPVWVGNNIAVGIKELAVDSEHPLVNQPMTLTTTLFNNEEDAVNVKSLTYTVDGSTVIGTDTEGYPIAAGGEIPVTFQYTPTVAKRMTITVTAVFQVGDKEFTYSKDITVTVRENEGDLPVTDIDVVNSQTEAGFEYAIEGVVTSNASGYDKDTAFFDCIYVQDATGGICCFPVSGEFKIGDKVHVEGYTDLYQGEPELQVTSIEIIGEGTVEPTEVTAAQINDLSVLGSLVTLNGTVDSVEEVNGLIQTIMIRDANGDVARVFIDGYITTENEVENCVVGAQISATGISSYDDTFNAPEGPFPRIRIRNRADIICTAEGPVDADHLRVMGDSRYDTAFRAADYMKQVNGLGSFDTVVVAYGGDFADALSGSYLAAVAEAPILLVHPRYEEAVFDYIKENAAEDAKIYLLGGTGVVSQNFQDMLTGYDVKRLGGANRFETNIQILEEANALGGNAKEVLIASATGFADALSTSSVGKPILLVGKSLNNDQRDYLAGAQATNAWIVGGTGAVSDEVAAELVNFVPADGIKRFEGANRYETSYMVAHEFFEGEFETAVIVYGQNFPDGLSGGAVASVIGAPVLLAMDRDDMIANVAKWVTESGATRSVTFGGPALISDDSIRTIMNDADAEIVLFE